MNVLTYAVMPVMLYVMMGGFSSAIAGRTPRGILPDFARSDEFMFLTFVLWPLFLPFILGWVSAKMMLPPNEKR